MCAALPVVLLDYDLPVSVLNQARSGHRFTFTVDASRPKGFEGDTRMAGAKVSVSYDDGVTWNSADVHRRDSNSFRASVRHPKLSATNGFVTIRTEVRDYAGNRTTETITRAYALG
ncbi:hypothetical protein ACIQ6K_39675 [Streptomyces sp. NPDC096354]|uniref:hypothetical protein n=1 Tax=Streptomyces sp. NPDC096354 TaxID=3366088 RepID=UPI0037F42CDB